MLRHDLGRKPSSAARCRPENRTRMTIFYFIRHAEHDLLGHELVGRRPGVHLNENGRAQAARLATVFSRMPLDGVLCSPRERARETAEPIAARRECPVTV